MRCHGRISPRGRCGRHCRRGEKQQDGMARHRAVADGRRASAAEAAWALKAGLMIFMRCCRQADGCRISRATAYLTYFDARLICAPSYRRQHFAGYVMPADHQARDGADAGPRSPGTRRGSALELNICLPPAIDLIMIADMLPELKAVTIFYLRCR